jgi:hypothetical protein
VNFEVRIQNLENFEVRTYKTAKCALKTKQPLMLPNHHPNHVYTTAPISLTMLNFRNLMKFEVRTYKTAKCALKTKQTSIQPNHHPNHVYTTAPNSMAMLNFVKNEIKTLNPI